MNNNRTEEIRDEIVKFLKQKYVAAAIEINGHNFAAADIAFNEHENPEYYRIMVIKNDSK